MENQVANIGLYTSYVLLGIAILVVLFVAVKGLSSNPKGAITIGLAIVAFGILYGISYGMADDVVTAKFKSKGVDANMSQMIGSFVNMMWFSLGLGILAIAFSQVKSLFK